jgi:hypothetical protein
MSVVQHMQPPRTLFEAVSDLASLQHGTQLILNKLVTAHTTTTDTQSVLMASLHDSNQAVAKALTSISHAATHWQTKVAGQPVMVGGRIQTEADEKVSLAETGRLSPVALQKLLAPLIRVEMLLAEIGIAENAKAREAATAHYATAVRELDEHAVATRYPKGLKTSVRTLALKLPSHDPTEIQAELTAKIGIVHMICAGALAFHATSHPASHTHPNG